MFATLIHKCRVRISKNDDTRLNDGDAKSLVNFAPVALFSEAKLTTSSGKHLEKIDNLTQLVECINF